MVNDQHGHLEGDYVIQSVANILMNVTRDFDVVDGMVVRSLSLYSAILI